MSKQKFPFQVNVCYLINKKGEVMLQLKSRDFGKGKWNGPGGKIREGESPEEATRREVFEETGITVKRLKEVGQFEFIFIGKEEWNNYMYAYICKDYSGTPENKDEGELKWFKSSEIPYDKMWEDDIHWLPQALKGEWMNMRFYFKDDTGALEKYKKLN